MFLGNTASTLKHQFLQRGCVVTDAYERRCLWLTRIQTGGEAPANTMMELKVLLHTLKVKIGATEVRCPVPTHISVQDTVSCSALKTFTLQPKRALSLGPVCN